jgi:hypothetical protein
MRPCEAHAAQDVRDTFAPNDQRGSPVDHLVPHNLRVASYAASPGSSTSPRNPDRNSVSATASIPMTDDPVVGTGASITHTSPSPMFDGACNGARHGLNTSGEDAPKLQCDGGHSARRCGSRDERGSRETRGTHVDLLLIDSYKRRPEPAQIDIDSASAR